MLNNYTFTPTELPKKYRIQIDNIFKDVVLVLVYCDGGGRHLLNAHLKEFDKIMRHGVGLVCLPFYVMMCGS